MLKRRKKWAVGDYFGIPVGDNEYALGQVASVEPQAMNSIVCALFALRRKIEEIDIGDIDTNNPISIIFSTRDLLDSGGWPVVASGAPLKVGNFIDLEDLKKKGFVGVKIIGSSNVNLFMNACFGLYPWDGMHDKGYFDKMLIDLNRRPASIIYKAES